MPDDFATFRAAHPSVSAALAECERLDWLILLAWEALDHVQAIRLGLSAASIVDDRGYGRVLFTPKPHPLEAVEAWAAKTDGDTASDNNLRAIALGAFPAVALASLVEHFFVSAPWTVLHALVYVVMIFGFEIICALAVRAVMTRTVRRRAEALDENAALELVLAALRRNAPKRPNLALAAMKVVGGRVRRLVDGESLPRES